MNLKDIPRRTCLKGPVKVSCSPEIRDLCARPYPDHPKGCPNVERCSEARYFLDAFGSDVYVAALEFDFGAYLKMMKAKQPGWSDRQLRCPLYWQGHLRKQLRDFLAEQKIDGYFPVWIPEAMGVNVTETCKAVGINLQWPPMTKTYVVVLFARSRRPEDEIK